MEISRINEILSDIDSINSVKGLKLISSNKSENYGEESYEHEEREKVDLFDIGHDVLLLQVVSRVDSYGDNERVVSLKFVKPIQKEVIVYE